MFYLSFLFELKLKVWYEIYTEVILSINCIKIKRTFVLKAMLGTFSY